MCEPKDMAGSQGSGDRAVDAITDALDNLRELPTSEHGAAYARLHDELLAELDAEIDA